MFQDLIEMKDHTLKWDEYYKTYSILHDLCKSIGNSDFGFRIQGLFAHALIRLGIKIFEVNLQGHPDIVGDVENKRIKLEVEAAVGNARRRIIDEENIEAIKPNNKNEKGYFAVLDCGLPPEWLLVDYQHLKWRCSESLSIIILKSLSDKEFSSKCTEQFFNLILLNTERLPSFTFSILRDRALRGEEL
jgi:hypothetical protein